MRSLAHLLKPYNLEDFLNNNWTNKAVAIKSEGKKDFAHLFSWEKLNHLLNFYQLKYPDIRLAVEGKVLDESENANLIKLCQSGATLILNQVHKLIPEIAEFAAEFKADLGYGNQVNAYCSWPEKQGFSSHYDTHEVFILQTDGIKQWYVFADTIKYPLTDQKSSSFSPPETPPYLTCTLHPGDVLYIPRGHWHYAIASDEPSLHLTLGIHCKTGIDLLEWLVGELRQQSEWRQSLPLRINQDSIDTSVNNLIAQLQGYANSKNLGEEYSSYLDSLAKPVAKYSLPSQAGFNIFPCGIQTKYRIPKFQRVRISELPDGDGYKIVVGGKEVSLRGVTAKFTDTLFSTEFFTGEDVMDWLPDCDWEIDVMPLLSRLVVEGIIFVS
ncbi:cupin [Tychonema sp. LEGE 07199]|uniref:cupin domain-containing protein n=1 Tax=unclassified Tychonema TaxID=2642144 RepID=UPI00188037C9|nr:MULTISPECIES: cupin domain-containing protein [unclassified Tychonema]MBE9121418.1 cupin [Tychonema sp. LEGE 07199]MBE9134636.1 cupin [Tychonema sp. LEGE 07196]